MSQSDADKFLLIRFRQQGHDEARRSQCGPAKPLLLNSSAFSLWAKTASIEEQLRSVEISIQQARGNGANITKADQERIVRGYRTA